MTPFNNLFSNEDISKVAAYLEQFKNHLPLIYKWKGLTDKSIRKLKGAGVADQQLSYLSNLKAYEQAIKIREIIGEHANLLYTSDDPKFNAIAHWIIYDWGGIRITEESRILGKPLAEFLANKAWQFDGISSCSKVASFLNPSLDAIYDSRVAHSLNWIFLSLELNCRFFKVPAGVGKSTTLFDIETIIRLRNRHKYFKGDTYINGDERVFLNEKDTYYYYRILLRKIHQKLWTTDEVKLERLYYTEMILFAIAQSTILNQIPKNVSVTIKNE